MKKVFTSISATTLTLMASFFAFVQTAQAAITNPALGEDLGGDPLAATEGTTFLSYFVLLWRAVITVGALMVIVFFVWGGIEWISAGGDTAKVQKARDRLTQSAIGLIVLVASFSIIGLLSSLFFGEDFNLLKLTIPTALEI
jgi:hypothetical protein